MQLENRFWPIVARFFASHKQSAIFQDDTQKYLCIFRRKKFEYLNVCLKAIKFSNECGYFSNFLRERSRWKIWLCRKSVAKKLHSLKKRLKTCLLKKFSWKQARKGFRTIRARRYFRYIQTILKWQDFCIN